MAGKISSLLDPTRIALDVKEGMAFLRRQLPHYFRP
jgi:hypothetical protein